MERKMAEDEKKEQVDDKEIGIENLKVLESLEDLISFDSASLELVRFQAELLSGSIWSGEEFSEHLSDTLHNYKGNIGIINLSDIPLTAILNPIRKVGERESPILFVDAQQSHSMFDQALSAKAKRGFWDVIHKKTNLKKALLQASPGFYLVPRGKYGEKPRHFHVFRRFLSILNDKFERVVLHYPQKSELWQSMIMESQASHTLLVLRDDYRLYRIIIPANHPFRIQEIFANLERDI